MKNLDALRLQQLEDTLAPFRSVGHSAAPKGGWGRAIRDALGLSNVQLSRRLGRKAPQSVEDILKSEAAGTIKLNTLRELAAALNCQLVYALVPEKPLEDIRHEQALSAANGALALTSHTMKLEDQGLTTREHKRAVERLAEKLLAGSPRKLWQ